MFVLRLVFAWLLIAAVPMQGFAAASMLLCGTGSAPQQTAPVGSTHDHAAMHNHAEGATPSHVHAADTQPGASPEAGHSCSVCAACCHSVALVGQHLLAATAPAPQAEPQEPVVRLHTLPTPVPDKPPRA